MKNWNYYVTLGDYAGGIRVELWEWVTFQEIYKSRHSGTMGFPYYLQVL